MKKYYIVKGEFENMYDLYYTESAGEEKALPKNAERITRSQALQYCKAERERERYRHEAAFSGYASATIKPAGHDDNIQNNLSYELRGYIWEKI